MSNALDNILTKYEIGTVDKISRISTGLINETYLVEAGESKFILQKLNPIFKKEANFDFNTVSKYLEKKGVLAQKILSTRNGNLFFKNGEEVWRLLTFIPGRVFIKADSLDIAYEAGKILGEFHLAVSDLDYKFKHSRPMHHATEAFFDKFHIVSESVTDPDIKRLASFLQKIDKLYLPNNLRKNITHGDPKISNIIFDEIGQGIFKAKALIDLDDCGRKHNILIELGDAFRSWCGGEEDDKNNYFDLQKFKAGLEGYSMGSRDFLKREERELLPQAIKLITLELAMRFLIDYFEDSYFGWDSSRYPSRKAHNLARAKGQLALFHDLEVKFTK